MSFGSEGGYGTPPFPPYGPTKDATMAARQAPPQEFTEDTGEFTLVQTFPPWTEAGSTSRFYIMFTHYKDGSIQPSGTTIAILDRYGNAVGTGAIGVTLGAVTQDPNSSNKYFSSVQFGASINPGDYVVEWRGTYTPVGSGQSLTIRSRQNIRVKTTKAPSQFYFLDTAKA